VEFLAALVFFWAAAIISPGLARSGPPAGPPLVIGHRGAAGIAPENTLAAFDQACQLEVDGVELDLLVSADGELVVHHDFRLKPEIARAADGLWLSSSQSRAVRELTLAQLKSYDVGRLNPLTAYAARYPDQKPADGERIPTLKETLDRLKTRCRDTTRLFLEIKTSPEEPTMTPPPEEVAEKLLSLLKREGFEDRTLILSFDWRGLVHVQEKAPGIPTVYLSLVSGGLNNIKPGEPGPSPWTATIDVDDFNGSVPRAVKAAGGSIWAPQFRNLSPEALKEARELGLRVFVWTPDSPADMKRLMDMGVDGIITNRPDRLKSLVGR
jgi:glycerophosphoryl diester phosphodiesterase